MAITITGSQIYGDVAERIDKRQSSHTVGVVPALPRAVLTEVEKLPAGKQAAVTEGLHTIQQELQRPSAPDESVIEAALRGLVEIAPAVLDVAAVVWPPLASVGKLIERVRG